MTVDGPPPPAGPGFVARWRAVLRRRRVPGGVVAAVVLAAAAALVLLARPVYRAEARLRLSDPPPPGGVSPTGGVLSFLRPGGDPFANDLELLSSRSLAEAVVREVALSATLVAPAGWHRDSVFVSLAVEDSTVEASYDVTWAGDGSIEVRRSAPTDSLVGRATPGEPIRFDGVVARFGERRPGGPESVGVKTLPLDEAVRRFSGRVSVERTRREANVLDLSFDSDDPGVTGAVLDATIRSFLALRNEIFRRESSETVDSLRTVTHETEAELLAAEAALERLQRETGLVAPDAQSEALIERYEAARSALEAADAEAELLAAQMARVEGAADPVEAWTALVASPAFLDNQTVGDILTRLTALAEERAEAASRRTPGSRTLRTIDERIAGLDAALRSLATEYRDGLEQRRRELRARVAAVEGVLDAVPSRVVDLGRRQRDVRVLSELLVLTEQRLRQEELREALSFATVQVIDPPAVRWRPVWPRKKLGLAVGFLLAVGAGTLAVVFAEAADGSVRSAAGVRALTGAPVVAAPILANGTPPAADLTAIRACLERGAVLIACDGARDEAGALTRLLESARAGGAEGTGGRRSAGGGPAAWPVEATPSENGALSEVVTYGEALGVARRGGAALLVVCAGRTERRTLERTAALLREAGARVVGTVVVCRGARDAATVWG